MLNKLSANTILKNQIKDWFFITIGIAIYVTGYVGFQLPYHITAGGVAGISAIVYYAISFSPQYTYLIINICLLCVALKLLGVKFLLNTIFAVGVMTVLIGAAQNVMMVDGELPKVLGDQSFMACVMGAAIEGIGLGIVFLNNGQDHEAIAKAINELGRGVTLLDAKGWYTRNEMKVLMVMARRRESTNIFRAIKNIDPNAFVSQSKVVGVFGNGFDRIKGK